MTAARYLHDVLQTSLLTYLDGRQQVFFLENNVVSLILRRTMDFFQEGVVNVQP